MENAEVVSALAALANEHRLNVYRMLVEAGPDGLSAGVIASKIGLLPSSLTFHLQQLHHAGLVNQRRLSRQIIYAMIPAAMNGLVAFLTENCCGSGRCAPACEPKRTSKARRKQAAA